MRTSTCSWQQQHAAEPPICRQHVVYKANHNRAPIISGIFQPAYRDNPMQHTPPTHTNHMSQLACSTTLPLPAQQKCCGQT